MSDSQFTQMLARFLLRRVKPYVKPKAKGVRYLLLVLLSFPVPTVAQTPASRAEAMMVAARSDEFNSAEQARWWFLALAEWQAEGARAILTSDRDRLERAVRQEGVAMIFAHRAFERACPEGDVLVPHPVSYMSYALGHWDGQRSGQPRNSSQLANTLLSISEDRRRDAHRIRLCNR